MDVLTVLKQMSLVLALCGLCSMASSLVSRSLRSVLCITNINVCHSQSDGLMFIQDYNLLCTPGNHKTLVKYKQTDRQKEKNLLLLSEPLLVPALLHSEGKEGKIVGHVVAEMEEDSDEFPCGQIGCETCVPGHWLDPEADRPGLMGHNCELQCQVFVSACHRSSR